MHIIARFLVDGDVFDYDPKIHQQRAGKFIFCSSDSSGLQILLVGDEDFSHERLFEDALYLGLLPPNFPKTKIDGAGKCSRGKVVSWESVHFSLKTSVEIQAMIKRILKM